MTEEVHNTVKVDRTVTRALAVVLMREVMPLLNTLDENIAAVHLQLAIDTVLGDAPGNPVEGSC